MRVRCRPKHCWPLRAFLQAVPGEVSAEPTRHYEAELEINDFPQHSRWKVGLALLSRQLLWRATLCAARAHAALRAEHLRSGLAQAYAACLVKCGPVTVHGAQSNSISEDNSQRTAPGTPLCHSAAQLTPTAYGGGMWQQAALNLVTCESMHTVTTAMCVLLTPTHVCMQAD